MTRAERRAGLVLAALVMLIATGGVAGAAEPRVRADTFGMNVQHLRDLDVISVQQRQRSMDKIAALGMGSARVEASWAIVDQDPNSERWHMPDAMVRQAILAGLRPRVLTLGVPDWTLAPTELQAAYANPDDSHHSFSYLPRPHHEDEWVGWIGRLVGRYGPNGTFWDLPENDAVPYTPVRDWEIWNEPNSEGFARPTDGVRFGRIFRLAADRVHQLDPQASVLVGGLDPVLQSDTDARLAKYSMTDFLSNMGPPAVHGWGVTAIPGVTRQAITWHACSSTSCRRIGTGQTFTIPITALNRRLRVDVWLHNAFGAGWAGRLGQRVTQ